MTQVELIEAVRIAVSEGVAQGVKAALSAIRKDDTTKRDLSLQLVEAYRDRLEDCQKTISALTKELEDKTHAQINAQTASETWRASSELRQRQIERLEKIVDDLRTRVREIEKNNHA